MDNFKIWTNCKKDLKLEFLVKKIQVSSKLSLILIFFFFCPICPYAHFSQKKHPNFLHPSKIWGWWGLWDSINVFIFLVLSILLVGWGMCPLVVERGLVVQPCVDHLLRLVFTFQALALTWQLRWLNSALGFLGFDQRLSFIHFFLNPPPGFLES